MDGKKIGETEQPAGGDDLELEHCGSYLCGVNSSLIK